MIITASKAQNWRTPPRLFGRLHAERRYTVDAAASISNHLLPRYWTAAHDAKTRSLEGERAFCNPPFSDIPAFLAWALERRDEGFVEFLLPARVWEPWFHEYAVHGDKTILRRRTAYVAPPRVKQSSPSFGSILVRFGPGVTPSGYGFSECRDGVTGDVLP